MADTFALDEDLTRWGRNPGGGLDERAREFLLREVGVGKPRAVVPWRQVAVPACRLSPDQLDGLRSLVGPDHVLSDDDSRRAHAGGLSYLDLLARRLDELSPPDAIVAPATSDEVGALLEWAGGSGVGVVPFGGGTSVVGGLRTSAIDRPTVMLDLARLCDVIDLDAESRLVTVGAGMTGPELERYLGPRGLTLGHFPQSWTRATIGGYAATRSAGQSSTGYGRSDDMVESMLIITPRGPLRVGRVAASAAGPELRALMIGSEGAFGIITEVTLRVRTLPAHRAYTAVVFPDYESGVHAFRDLAQQRATSDVMRLSDPQETAVTLAMSGPGGTLGAALDRYLRLRGVTSASLAILGWEGPRTAVAARRLDSLGILRGHGAVSLGASTGEAWRRHRFDGPFLRDELMDDGYLVETLETATHWSRLLDLRTAVADAIRGSLGDGGPGPYVMSHISHVYETGASLYFTVIGRQNDHPVEQWQGAKTAAMQAIVDQGATITHHHAVGRDHAPYLAAEVSPLGVDILRAVKGYLDPGDILNPGVLLGGD